jgi:hypothetical protein
MRPVVRSVLTLTALVLVCLLPAGALKAETSTPQLLALSTDGSIRTQPFLRMANTQTQAAPLPGEERAEQIGRMETLEALSIASVAGGAAVLGFFAGGVSYSIAAGSAVVLTYMLLP